MNYENLPLKDIQLPGAISYWPLPIGWWILLMLAVFIPLIFILYKNWKEKRLITTTINQFNKIRLEFNKDKDSNKLAKNLSTLLRQIVITKMPRKNTASIVGQDWLSFLDKIGCCKDFSSGVGKQLSYIPYQDKGLENVDELLLVISKWINTVLKNKTPKEKRK